MLASVASPHSDSDQEKIHEHIQTGPCDRVRRPMLAARRKRIRANWECSRSFSALVLKNCALANDVLREPRVGLLVLSRWPAYQR